MSVLVSGFASPGMPSYPSVAGGRGAKGYGHVYVERLLEMTFGDFSVTARCRLLKGIQQDDLRSYLVAALHPEDMVDESAVSTALCRAVDKWDITSPGIRVVLEGVGPDAQPAYLDYDDVSVQLREAVGTSGT